MGIDEIRKEIKHLDEVELKAYGRKHRLQPESDEYREAKAEWKRRQQRKQEIPEPQPVGPTSKEFSEMAKAAGGRYPWMWYPKDGVR